MTLKKYTIKIYEPSDYCIWNAFISTAKNGTFLFHRDFMEYHQDRFEDYSLLVFSGKNCVAVLPANTLQNTVFSHSGLSYGGLVYEDGLSLVNVIGCFKAKSTFNFAC